MPLSKEKSVTIEDFVLAIAVSCPFQMLYHHYIADLVASSPKSKNDKWMGFYKSLQASEAPVTRSWRIWAHKTFMKNLTEIEKEFWRRSYYISDSANSFKIIEYLEAAMATTKLTKQEFKSTKKYLRERSGVEYGESSSDTDSFDDSKKKSTPEDDTFVEAALDDRDDGSSNGEDQLIRPIDPSQISPLRINQIITCLYRATGLALADDADQDIVSAMEKLTTDDSSSSPDHQKLINGKDPDSENR